MGSKSASLTSAAYRIGAKNPAASPSHLRAGRVARRVISAAAEDAKMAALTPGTQAPDFTLPAIDDKLFSLRAALARGPVIAGFFKISCPTCQYTFPFLQRIDERHGSGALTIVGISQNTKKDTAAFIKEYGIRFQVLLDDTHSYPVSNAYGLTNVPTIFWIASDGEIEMSSVGWVRKD